MSEEECDEYEYEDDFEEDESEEKQPTPRKEPTPRRPRAAPPAPAVPPTPAAPPSPPIPSPVISPAAKQQPWSLITLDDLERGEHIASGSMGSIYAATWRGRRVALKSLHDPTSSALKETEEELLVHAALGHKHIVELLGANLAPRGCCIVLELCRESLFVRLYRRREEMERRTMVTIALHVARAVEYMHARSPSVVHRDIKSHNVLLDFDGTAKLCDFGLVNTREVTAGTPNYMAPELFLGKAHGSAVDIFAFGVLLNEVFAREVPWDGYQPFDIKDRVVRSERPPMPSTMPRVCEGLVRKAWHQTACIRPRASQLVSALADVEDSLPVHTISARMLGDDALDQFASMRLSRTT